jgi:predicted outer membrane protein
MRKLLTKRGLAIAAAMLAFGFVGRATAADPAAPAANPGTEARNPADPAGQPAETSHVDQMVADQLLEMSRGEVELANFALKHSQNEEVRRFAQMMVQDHTNLNNQLERFASPGLRGNADRPAGQPGTNTAPPPATTGAPGATIGTPPGAATAPPAATDTREATDNKANGDQIGIQVCEDISRNIGAGVEKELSQFQGIDFDRAYIGQQFWGHVVFMGAARGAENHVSANLKQVLNEGTTTAGKHLEDCRKLIRDLSSNVARGNETAPPRR